VDEEQDVVANFAHLREPTEADAAPAKQSIPLAIRRCPEMHASIEADMGLLSARVDEWSRGAHMRSPWSQWRSLTSS